VQRVDHPARPVGVKRVHREVAALGVFLDPAGKGHHGAAAIGFHIAAEGGDFVRLALRDDRHGACSIPVGMTLKPAVSARCQRLFRASHRWQCRCRDRLSQQVVAQPPTKSA
jgi:hypothetical protein